MRASRCYTRSLTATDVSASLACRASARRHRRGRHEAVCDLIRRGFPLSVPADAGRVKPRPLSSTLNRSKASDWRRSGLRSYFFGAWRAPKSSSAIWSPGGPFACKLVAGDESCREQPSIAGVDLDCPPTIDLGPHPRPHAAAATNSGGRTHALSDAPRRRAFRHRTAFTPHQLDDASAPGRRSAAPRSLQGPVSSRIISEAPGWRGTPLRGRGLGARASTSQ